MAAKEENTNLIGNKPSKTRRNRYLASIKIISFLWVVLIACFIFSNSVELIASEADSIKNARMQIKNSEGREFWLCFMKNFKDDDRPTKANALLLELFITGDKDANVKIEVRSIGFSQSIFVPGGTVKSIKIDPMAQVRTFEFVEKQHAVHITSDNPISVYGLNRRFQTTDTYLGLPLEVLGTEYRVMSYSITDDLLSLFAIVATENATVIEIAPSVETFSGKKPNEIYRVTLNRGDVYQVAGKRVAGSRLKSDLTGTYIKSNKKIAVFGGHQCAYVPSVVPEIIACNHLAEQLPPIHSWGKHFYIGRMKLRSKYTYRVLAHQPNTKIFENANLVQVLNAGEVFEKQTDQDVQVTADKPVLVAQYSQGFKNGDSIGDPMMLLISPTQQFLRKYRFATPINGEWEHIVNIVVPTNSINTMQLNGKPIDTSEFKPFGISRYSIAFLTVPFGTHVIEGAMPFGMYSYGFGRGFDAFDAYGSMGGQSFSEYEPIRDVIPPAADLRVVEGKELLILRDDGRDDTGIKDINILDISNIDFKQPSFIEATPQYAVNISPRVENIEGRLTLQVRDMALNVSVFTICYYYDQYDDVYKFSINEGLDAKCSPDLGYNFGLFGKFSYNFHYPDFSKTGNIAAAGKFLSGSGTSGIFGFLASKVINQNWTLTGKLTLENYSGVISAPDSTKSNVRDIVTGELKTFQEQRNLELTGNYTSVFIGAEYNLNSYMYLTAGLVMSINLTSTINYEKEIIQPNDFTYPNEKRTIKLADYPNELNSINTLRLGLAAGAGVAMPIYRRYSAFMEAGYYQSLMDITHDASWKMNQLSILFGVKVRI